jgi:hypothetical protein
MEQDMVAPGTTITTALVGKATQGRMQPAAFSSGLRPGQSMR